MTFVATLRSWFERASKPGVQGAPGQALERQCARDVAGYFRNLARKVESLDLGQLADKAVAEATHIAEIKLNRVLRTSSPVLAAILSVNLHSAYVFAAKQAVYAEAKRLTPDDIDRLGASGHAAVDYATEHSAELVTKINDVTKQRLKDAIAAGIEQRLGVGGLGRLIRNTVLDMAVDRSNVIATTEMNDAMSQAALDKLVALQVSYKQIILSDDACPICEENAAEDPIPVDESYTSGDTRPPFHPNCRCAIAGAHAPEDEQ